MPNLALYRKYRPGSFSEIAGQEHVVQTLTNAISRGMISHAYLFSGPRGTGKTTLARLFAKAVNCRDRKGFEPCNKCSSCLEVKEGRSLDLIEIDAASHRGIDEIRELRDTVRFSPTKEKYKVFIIDESHQLTKEAANALLKTLEEPPSHAIFILATTEIHKMIPTIISRCQRFDFRKLTMSEITKRLEYVCKQEKAKVEKPALEFIAVNSSGGVRDAESLLDQTLAFSGVMKPGNEIKLEDVKDLLGIADTNLISQLVDLMIDRKTGEAIKMVNDSFEKGRDLQEFTKSLVKYLRQAAIIKISPELMNPVIAGFTKEEQEKIVAQTAKIETDKIRKMLVLFMDAENKVKYSSIPQLPLEMAIVDVTIDRNNTK